jgi:hypothetical protein
MYFVCFVRLSSLSPHKILQISIAPAESGADITYHVNSATQYFLPNQ